MYTYDFRKSSSPLLLDPTRSFGTTWLDAIVVVE